MKRNKKLAVSVISFALAFTCLIGGTYAWYVVSNTAKATFSGHTAEASEGLTLGVVKKGKTFDSDDKATWAKNIENQTLGLNDYAPTDGFHPVTSRTYADDQDITLYEAPKYLTPLNTTKATKGFAQFELVFKSKKVDAAIYLDEALTSFTDTSEKNSVLKALRIGFESDIAASIYNPHPDRGLTETLDVGGRMDLNGDGVWDYDYDLDGHTDKYAEIIYGDVTEEVKYSDEPSGTPRAPVPYSNPDALVAESVLENSYHGDTDYAIVDSIKPGTQASHGSKYYVYNATATATAENHPLVKTSKQIGGYYYGVLKVTMWIEGWDPACRYDLTADQDFSYNFGFVAPELVSADGKQF